MCGGRHAGPGLQEVVQTALEAGSTFLCNLSTLTGCHGCGPFCFLSHRHFLLFFCNLLFSSPTLSLSFPYERPIIHHLVQFIYVKTRKMSPKSSHDWSRGWSCFWLHLDFQCEGASSDSEVDEDIRSSFTHQLETTCGHVLHLVNCRKTVRNNFPGYFFSAR